jgi:hypothetical protein
MNIIKNFLSSFKIFQNRNRYYNYILENDIETNNKIRSSNDELSVNGYIIFKKFLSKEIIDQINSIYSNNNLINFDILYKILIYFDQYFQKTLNNYLGKEIMLCSLSLMDNSKEKVIESISNSWHTDNLGHKLNMLVCIEGDGKIPTFYLPGTHRNLYKPKLFEEFRVFKKNLKKIENSISINHETADCSILDSNGKHRGYYEGNDSLRKLLLLDFIKIDKFKKLSYKNTELINKAKVPFRIKKDTFNDNKIVPEDVYKNLMNISFICKENFYEKNGKYYCLFI